MERRLRAGLVAAAAVALTACSPTIVTPTPAAPTTTKAQGNPAATCGNATQTYPALTPLPKPGQMPDGILAAIQARGRLVVGVTADAAGLGARNPLTGAWEGFDVDVYNRLATAIFGKPEVDIRVLTQASALQALNDGEVDVVVMHYAMTCGRWAHQAAFSAPYLASPQEFLVRKGAQPTLKGQRVCVVAGTPSPDSLPKDVRSVVARDTITECLAAFEAGDVDAISDDAVVLAGLLGQNPFLQRVSAAPLATHQLAVAARADRPQLAQLASAVIARSISDGSWQKSWDTWLRPRLGDGRAPAPTYGRQP